MAKNEIRLRYTGFIVFLMNVLSIATRFAFVIMVTRSVSTEEFGIWGNVSDVFGYFIVLAGVFPFWTTRFIARGHHGSAKTGLIANILVSLASASIYLLLLPILLPALQISAVYTLLYTLLSIEIIESHLLSVLEAILYARQPQSRGYGILLYEVSKVILAFIFIIQLQLGLLGALLSILASYFIQILFYLKLTAGEFKEGMKWA